jgi:uncharacterized membrane protein
MDNRLSLISGIGIGAGLMYLLDPDRGNQRRALVRDQVVHSWHTTGDALDTTTRDMSHRAVGFAAEARSRLRREDITDEVLIERVRSKIGRVVSHPRSIAVTAHQGRVTLSGPILAREVDNLLAAVAAVRGVTDVENWLEVHETAGSVPGLQGEASRPGPQIDLLQRNWSPTARLLAGATGGALAVYAASRRCDALGTASGLLGAGLLGRALTNLEMKRLVGVGGGREAVDIQKTINVDAPVDSVFGFWANYENFPRWMSHVREVKETGDGRSHWVVDGPAGVPVEWDAELTQFVPDEVIAWKSAPGAAIRQAGRVRFAPNADGSTRIDIKMTYNPPAGALGHGLATMLGANPKRQMDDDLARLKTLIETGQPPHDAAQPSFPAAEAFAR